MLAAVFFIFIRTVTRGMTSLRLSVLILILCMFRAGFAQQKDTTGNKILDTKVAREIIGAVTRNSTEKDETNVRSENEYIPYQGKIVRRIIIRKVGFEKSIYDSSKSIRNRVTKIANALHSDTRERVIRDNLFFRENKPLNPYRLADNERYLRDLDFILDSRIHVIPISGNSDSVDVEVLTRDVFSLGVRAKLGGVDEFSVGIYDANLSGYGQRVQADFLFHSERDPLIGKGFLYRKSSLGGSLINVSVAYTELDNGRSLGEENEYAYYLRLDRPLVSPYSRMAGGIEFSENWSVNVMRAADSIFRRYRYLSQDYWVGYNIGIKNNPQDRDRHFIALRYSQQHFRDQPSQEDQLARRIYNDNRFLLAEFTFYNQNFYKTNYIYGFGRTEDVPYGQTVNITAGWTEELGLRRFYAGTSAARRIVRPTGRFYDLEIGAGTFFRRDVAEDGVIYAKGSYYSKLYDVKRTRMRHLFQAGYARAFNNRVRELLTLENQLNGFRADSLFGFQRMFLRSETTVFTPHRLIGFRIAPFASLEFAYLESKEAEADHVNRDVFWGATGGVRIRNENLIFGTVEFRGLFYPKVVPGVERLGFIVTTRLRIKYSGVFVRPPSFVTFN